ncbi:MAG: hypothetical protein FWE70_00910 [Oscillospiraceae bacterium]|nr:hypothetical protein [Oscillospiraceae bacterium]
MDNRERAIKAAHYRPVDKLPLTPGGPRESTLARWRAEGLPEGADWYAHILGEAGVPYERPVGYVPHHVDTRMVPTFEEEVLSHEGGHYIVRDWMGAVTEISDEFDYTYIRGAKDFVTRKWHSFPVRDRADWPAMRARYDPDEPSRYPADAGGLRERMEGRGYASRLSVNGPFWQMREWMGFEGLCIALMDDPAFVAEMAEFWRLFIAKVIRRAASLIPFDFLCISEDMAYKAHAMISPAMVREYCAPAYREWGDIARGHGVSVVSVDSDGYVGELIPIWVESGVDMNEPQEVAAHNDVNEYRVRYGRDMAYGGGIDKRAIAAGGAVMEAEVRRVVEPFMRAGGGLLPGCDHGVPPDISLGNFVEYTRLLAKLTGWL